MVYGRGGGVVPVWYIWLETEVLISTWTFPLWRGSLKSQWMWEEPPGQPCRIHAYTVYTTIGGKGRCRTRGESEESVVHRRGSMQVRESTLALKPRADVTRSPKQGYQWPHKKDLCPTKILKKKKASFLPTSSESQLCFIVKTLTITHNW